MSAVLEPQAVPQRTDEVPVDRLYRFTVEQYHALIGSGIIDDPTPFELLDGLLVKKMGKDGSHCVTLGLLRRILDACLPDGWILRVQDPVTLDLSEPEPDAAVVRGEIRDYTDEHPTPDDIGILAEVANTTLAFDRGFKRRLYARNGVQEYWVVNIRDGVVEVHTQPTGPDEDPDYRTRRVFAAGQSVSVRLDDSPVGQIDVSQILP